MNCRFPLTVGLVLLALSLAGIAGAEDFTFFESKIRPILVDHCYECHSAKSKPIQGGLRVDTRDGLRRGGDSGPAVTPGNADESSLISALRHESFEMPPKGKLAENIIRDFEKWIERGAADPRKDAAAAAASRRVGTDFWSYRPIRPVAPPKVRDADWPSKDLDRFVLHRLEQAGLHPNNDSSPLELLRRVVFDLTGLPPSVDQVRRFETQNEMSRDAYERLVDELLESPEFGETWARHWLDVARYAESTGGGRTRIFDSAWRYRDYVIRSLNHDKSFARFAEEHVAGDLLDHPDLQSRQDGLIATGFLVLGPINYELQDKELLRMEVIDEQLDVFGRAFLGMTIGCARCHDHKFDPLETSEYYALAGILRSTKSLTPGNVSGFVMRPLPMSPTQQAKYDEVQSRIAPLSKELAEVENGIKKLGKTDADPSKRIDPATLTGFVVDDTAARQVGAWTSSTSIPGYVADRYIHDASEMRGRKRVEYEAKLPDGEYEVRISYTASSNRASNALVTVWSEAGESSTRVNQRKRPPIDGSFISLGKFRFSANQPARVVIRNDDADGVVIADCVQWLPDAKGKPKSKPNLAKASPKAQAEEAERKQQILALRAKQKSLQGRLSSLRSQAPTQTMVMSVAEEAKPEDFFVCIRGNVHLLGDKAPRGFPASLTVNSAAIPPGQSGRLQLAHWLTDPQNPRTSRVIVNRVWGHLFGYGIARNPDDLGAMGETPSHPELLDHLSSEFMRDGWSMKRLIKRIVMSRTYRLSTGGDHRLVEKDPENLLLGRAHRRRLPAEAIRDAALAVSGQLDRTRGGRTLKPNTRSEFGYQFDNVENRRSIYVPVLRNTLHDFLAVFDIADPNLVSGRRNVSTLPTQSLFLMNSPEIWRLAESAAERLQAESHATEAARVDTAYRRFLSRPPSPRERTLTLAFLSEQKDRKAGWAKVCQSLFASVDFRYSQ